MDLKSQWLDVLRTCNEPLEIKDRDQVEQEKKLERYVSWQEECEHAKRLERSRNQDFRRR
jgi:hypothetical protein